MLGTGRSIKKAEGFRLKGIGDRGRLFIPIGQRYPIYGLISQPPAPASPMVFNLFVFDVKSHDLSSFEGMRPSDLRKVISERKITDLYLDLPLSNLGFRILKLPFSDKKRLNEVIPFELQDLIMEDIDDLVFDSLCLGKDGEMFDILVVYMGKNRLTGLLNSLSDSGIDPAIAGSVVIGSIIRETRDSSLIIKRLIDYSNKSGPDLKRIDYVKEELENPTINLRTGPLEFKKESARLSAAFRVMAFLLIGILVIINLDLSFRIVKHRKDITLIKREIKKSYSDLFPSEKRIVDEVYQLKAYLKEARQRMDLMGSVQVLDFLSTLSRLRTGGVVFHEIGLSTEGLSLKGDAASMDEINRLKSGLSDVLQEISASEIKPSSGGRLGFTISGRIKR